MGEGGERAFGWSKTTPEPREGNPVQGPALPGTICRGMWWRIFHEGCPMATYGSRSGLPGGFQARMLVTNWGSGSRGGS